MFEVAPIESKQTVESRHGGAAGSVQTGAVHEETNGETAWDGVFQVFDEKDGPSCAIRAYSWSYERDDRRPQFFAVLHTGLIQRPKDAVRAAIAPEASAK